MAAPLEFRKDWTIEVKEMFADDDPDNSLPRTAAILRVPTPLLKMKPEAFIPQLLSFGPYHHSKLEKDIDSPYAGCKISMAERYKVKSAVMFSKKLRQGGKNFKSIVEMMNQMRPEIENFYRWPISTEGEYSQNFALMMAIDSSFLLQFLNTLSESPKLTLTLDPETQRFCMTYYACVLHDIIKVENQIPLFVLKGVLDYVIEDTINNEILSFNHLLPVLCENLSPFPYVITCIAENKRNILIAEMAKEPHLVGCIHRFLSEFPNYIRLDKYSGTLYLPQIFISDIGTEVYLRNMLALEFNDDLRPKYVTHYVALMGNLIQSPDDVRILVDRHVISRGMFNLSEESSQYVVRRAPALP